MRVVGPPRAFYHASRLRLLERSAEASQALGLPRSTLYRWQKPLREQGPKGLEDKGRPLKAKGQAPLAGLLAEVLRLAQEKGIAFGRIQVVGSTHTTANVDVGQEQGHRKRGSPMPAGVPKGKGRSAPTTSSATRPMGASTPKPT